MVRAIEGGWYSWVGSNHRPPVPQTEICFCPLYASLRQSTNYSAISISKIALGTLHALLVFCYRGSYVVAKPTDRNSDGFGKYHDQSRASTRFG